MTSSALHAYWPDFKDPLLATAAGGFLAPRPAFADDRLARILFDGWELKGTLTDLGGERDCNTRVELAGGRRLVLKIFSPDDEAQVRAFQHQVMLHLERSDIGLTPKIYPTRDGALEAVVTDAEGGTFHAVLIDLMPGRAPQPDGSAAQQRMIGRGIAELHHALRGLDCPAANRVLLWDQMNAPRLREAAEMVENAALRARILGGMDHLEHRMPALGALPAQLIHNDLSQSNMLVAEDNPLTLSGIFDFGDMVIAPRINDISIAASYFTLPDRPLAPQLANLVAGYEEVIALGDDELAALPDAMLARMLLRLIIPLWRSALFPANRAYLLRHFDAGRALAERLLPPEGSPGRAPFAFDRSHLDTPCHD
ncbi:phosphotransferase [Salipiger bermudensis]|uniref:phosphotransferase n=1 Tax=Salipiger bermudensis TaxID=344736 RepID=UPI001C9A2345|nr:phosphotransferase [Salipiger bermudensis]MBY6005302.1 phosphotransferase [Salipiger bermudensis]